MRLYIILIFTAVLMAFSSGYFLFFLKGPQEASENDIQEINLIKTTFQERVAPVKIVNLSSLYFNQDQFDLMDPIHFLENRQKTKDGKYSTESGCFKDFPKLLNRNNFEKVWIWEEFRCSRRRSLPRNFFLEAPYVHPSGYSYAYLALFLGKGGYSSRNWVDNHLPFFHVIELESVQKKLGELSGVFGILANLNQKELVDLSRGVGTILSRDYLFAKLLYPEFLNILEYRIYNKKNLETFLRNTSYTLKNYEIGMPCFYKDGNLCWEINAKHVFKMINTGSLLFFFGMMIIIVIVVRLLITRLHFQKLEDEKRRWALRVLTHEFRTPITTMLLHMERMGQSFNDLSEDQQESYLGLNSEVHRMKRLTEMSRNYLSTEKSIKLVQSKKELVESMNDFVEDIICPYWDKYGDEYIKFNKLDEDISLCIDPYWTQICFKNLIENACYHGKPTVIVTLNFSKDNFCLSVQDEGSCEFSTLNELSEEFIKGNKSEGTGLGMNIVKKVCDELGYLLSLSLTPTTFKLTIKRGKNDKNTIS